MKLFQIAATAVILAGCAAIGTGEDKKVASPLTVKMKTIDGKDLDLSKYKGKVVLIVNVASKCGYTPQYEGLQALYEEFKDEGLSILAFPCDQFGHQEPGDEAA